MIPDTFAGGLLLSVVNMAVVFSVLAFLALVINLFHGLFGGKARGPAATETVAIAQEDAEIVQEDAGGVTAEDLPSTGDAKVRAAIAAALAAYMSTEEKIRVFTRDIQGSGVWGSSSRSELMIQFRSFYMRRQ